MNFSAKARKPDAFCTYFTGHTLLQFMRISVLVTMICLTASGLLLAATVRGQNAAATTVTLGLKHESLETAIKELEAQTGFHFFYRRPDIKDIQNLTLRSGTYNLADLLHQLLDGTFISYRQIDGSILLEKKQGNYIITGKVINEKRQPVDFATVNLLKNKQQLQATQTDTSGGFRLTARERGDYIVKVSSVGMDSLTIAVTLSSERKVTLPDLMLSTSVQQLRQVNVVSSRPLIEQKIDRTVVNVDQLLTASGMTALDVLQKSPGVQVDPNGGVSLKGKSGVVILIDDRPTYLTGDALTNYLKSLPASTLDQLEIMTNPPAKYDAAGNAGVINIKIKKSQARGFNGGLNLAYLQADHPRTNNSFNFNYRNNKVNLFGNLDYNIDNADQNLAISRAYLNPNGSALSAFAQDTHFNGIAHSGAARVGMDYYASDRTIFGIVLNGNLQPDHHDFAAGGTFTNGAGGIDSTLRSHNHDAGHFNNSGINLNMRHSFKKEGQELTADLDYLMYHTASEQQFSSNTYLPDASLYSQELLNGNLPANVHIYSAKADYTQPITGGIKFSAGLKSSYTTTDNVADYISTTGGGPLLPDYGLSNHFLYRESINAGYVNFNKDFKLLSVQAGLRVENTQSDGHQLGNAQRPDSAFNRHYLDLFPTVYFSYKLDTAGNNILGLSYGRRVDRPFYRDLNPFTTTVDRYTYYVGNPFLNPAFTNKVELSLSLMHYITFALDWSHIGGDIDETIQIQNGIFYSRPANVNAITILGGSVDAGFDPAKWLSLHLYAEVMNDDYLTTLPTGKLSTQGTYYYLDPMLQFKLSPTWTAQLDGYYRNRVIATQFILAGRGEANIGISKKVSDNLTLRLTVNDFTHAYVNSGVITDLGSNEASYRNISDTRVAIFSFSYRFGKAISNLKQHKANGAQEEQNRVKQ